MTGCASALFMALFPRWLYGHPRGAEYIAVLSYSRLLSQSSADLYIFMAC